MMDILRSFKKLAIDDITCNSLLQDESSLGGLVILLSNEIDKTVLEILEIFSILAKKNNGIYVLKKIPGLRAQLHSLSISHNRDPGIVNKSKQLLQSIYNPKPEAPQNRPLGRHRFDYKKSRSIVVELNGSVTKSALKFIETEIIKIRGVISITFQLAKCRVVVLALNDVDPEMVLNQVTEGCRLASLSADHKSISARVVQRQKSTCSRGIPSLDFDRRSCVTTKAAPKLPSKLTPHLYLAENADLFEVDESRGAPQRQDAVARNDAGGGGGLGGWLSGLIERTVFW